MSMLLYSEIIQYETVDIISEKRTTCMPNKQS